MANILLAFGGLFLILAIVVLLIVFFVWWLKLRKIKKNIPKIDMESAAEVHKLNYDPSFKMKPMYESITPNITPKNTQITEKEVENNEQIDKINRLARELAETEREIARLREQKQVREDIVQEREQIREPEQIRDAGTAPLQAERSSEQYESIQDASSPKTSGLKRSNKQFRFKPI